VEVSSGISTWITRNSFLASLVCFCHPNASRDTRSRLCYEIRQWDAGSPFEARVLSGFRMFRSWACAFCSPAVVNPMILVVFNPEAFERREAPDQ
jgi:hypothetical protein